MRDGIERPSQSGLSVRACCSAEVVEARDDPRDPWLRELRASHRVRPRSLCRSCPRGSALTRREGVFIATSDVAVMRPDSGEGRRAYRDLYANERPEVRNRCSQLQWT